MVNEENSAPVTFFMTNKNKDNIVFRQALPVE